MAKNRIGYLIFLCIGIYLVILYDEYVSVVSLFLLMAIPFFSGVGLLFWRWRMDGTMEVSEKIVKMGEDTKKFLFMLPA